MGVQVSGLVSGLNWQQIINELISADSGSINQVKAQQTIASQKQTAIGSLSTDMTTLQTDVFNLEDPTDYGQVSTASTTTGSTWTISAENGTAPGNHSIAVSQLATASKLTGAAGISTSLGQQTDGSDITLATMATATAPTAGTITVDGQQINITTAETLADVFSAIQTATGVTGSYDPTSDKVTLTGPLENDGVTHAPVTLGAANDTSNLLQVLKLGNTGNGTTTSTAALGTVAAGNPLTSAHLATALTGQDSSGNGTFVVNGVSISYNTGTDTLTNIINRINTSTAGVTASYDPQLNQMTIANKATGDTAINLSDTSGNLMAALGLTSGGATTTYGKNALFSVDGGAQRTSTSNALTSADLGVSGLNVTVDSQETQTITIAANANNSLANVESFITDFNKLQTDITNNTKISSVNGTTVTSLLSSEHEVSDWGSSLENAAFSAGSGSGGLFTGLDSLGIDFSGITGQLVVSDTGKLQNALTANPAQVQAFFATAKTGFGSIIGNTLNDLQSQATAEVSSLQSQYTDLGNQITTMQTQLDAEQANLESEFTAMETAEAQMQSEESTLSGLSGTTGSSGASTLSSATPSVSANGTQIGSNSSSSSSSSSS